MNKATLAGLVSLALGWSCAVHAEGYDVGAVAGVVDADVAGDNPFNLGVRGGYEWSTGWGVEGELTTSVSDGKANLGFYGTYDYSVDTYAVYATYRTHGDIYFKGRLGFLDEEVDAGPVDHGDSGVSGGAGVGFDLGNDIDVQLEYTRIEKDLNLWSGSLVVRF